MSREALLEQYDHVGDYWATWLGRASMLPETQDRMTDKQLREIIKLMLSPWARQGWLYHDYDKYEDAHTAFYEEWSSRLDVILDRPVKKRRNVSNRRPTRATRKLKLSRKAKGRQSRNRHTKSQTIRRSTRPGPSQSAAESKVGKRAKGNDGNMYVVKLNKNKIKRWTKI